MASEGLFSTSRKMSSFLPSFSQGPGIYCASCSAEQWPQEHVGTTDTASGLAGRVCKGLPC